MHDLENVPQELILEVLDLRAFVRTKAALNSAKTPGDGPTGPMSDRIWAALKTISDERKGR